MHELSYAYSILNSILESIKDYKDAKVKEIHLEIGRLIFINPDQLRFAFEVIAEGTACEGAELKIEFIDPKCKCLKCGYEGKPEIFDEIEIYCPKCKSLSLKFEGGKEFLIKNVILIR
ncbi:hydrogenase maturation nickel metallochaperone HypA [Methanocaldococcus infernus]